MKKILRDRIIIGIGIVILSAFACERSNTDKSFSTNIQNHDQFVYNSQVITIHDKSGNNKLTLRLHSKNSTLLSEFVLNEWELKVMFNQDDGVEPIHTDDDDLATKTINPLDKIKIEFVKIELQANVVGYYIEKKFNPDKINKKFKNKLVETEFISARESFGGYIQIATAGNINGNSIHYIAETLDDAMVAPVIGIFELNEKNRYLSLGFSDINGLVHSWRVTVRHESSTFPIIYWIGEVKQLNQYP